MEQSSELARVWHPRERELTWREIDDEVIVLDLRSSMYLRLNASSAVLWRRLETGASIIDLAELLRQTYDIDQDRATVDVRAFISSCEQKNLLRTTDE